MKREIKFRAKDYTDTWIYGFVGEDKDGAYIIPTDDDGRVRVDDTTIGQYTELHDKYGREIYEGDIVAMMRTPEKRQKRIMVRHIAECVSVSNWHFKSLTEGVLTYCMAGFGSWDSYKMEVVGNIYDNPELAQREPLPLPEPKKREKRKPRSKGCLVVKFIVK
jgi:uncharacterized phage protein (TIGR01671 family)